MRPTAANFFTFVGLPVLLGAIVSRTSSSNSGDSSINALAPVVLGLYGLLLWLFLILFGDIALLIVRATFKKRP